MPDERKILTAFMSKLIAQCGGYDAAVAILEARWDHPVSKGTLSKKKSGILDWTVTDVIALQEAVGKRPVFDWLNSLDDDPEVLACHIAGAADLSREYGDAMSAVLSARTPDDKAKAIKELHDVRGAADRLIGTMEAMRK
ncbi:hypothetical protein [Falsirhodobacter halotolerans]|uniref:hypothetical protein n=1 Tax=Falsirhodobacter halotolerans TaxID=1146892 RepID=UPI001FD59D5B|nr:hypothetical protein [Falsirhodobacter halotolerans]MCJ8139373.1 hypothetical protein [Falsirhodobacter halotolerans]